MNTFPPDQDGPSPSGPLSGEQPVLSSDPQPGPAWLYDDDQEDGSVSIAPFQMSGPMAAASSQTSEANQDVRQPARSARTRHRFPSLKVVLTTLVVLITLGLLGGIFLPAASTHLITASMPLQSSTTKPTPRKQRRPPSATPPIVPASSPGTWVPPQLPPGWIAAGLTTGDALFAERTASTFTDREMSLDYRDVGMRGQHGGTLTAAVFLLTPAAQQRFFANDVRAINNTLFDTLESERLIQAVVPLQPNLIQFEQQGQQQFAWVTSSFLLWQSPNPAQRTGGIATNPATGMPLIHHMLVLLLRMTPGTQGPNAPMGGTGWLVSGYSLDPPGGTLPPIVQPA